jgi:hypothetical protein
MKITQYQTAYGNNPRELDEAVNRLINGGWQPFGSPYAMDNPVKDAVEPMILAQAMVRAGG